MLYLNLSCPVRLCVGEHLLNSLYAGLIRNGRAACMALGLSSLAMTVQKVEKLSVATDNFTLLGNLQALLSTAVCFELRHFIVLLEIVT